VREVGRIDMRLQCIKAEKRVCPEREARMGFFLLRVVVASMALGIITGKARAPLCQ